MDALNNLKKIPSYQNIIDSQQNEEFKNMSNIVDLLHKEWQQILRKANVFSNDSQSDINEVVSEDNVEKILKVLELTSIISKDEALNVILNGVSNKLSFRLFSEELISLLNNVAEEDFSEIVNSYSVPAERIVRTLKTLKEKYLGDD